MRSTGIGKIDIDQTIAAGILGDKKPLREEGRAKEAPVIEKAAEVQTLTQRWGRPPPR